MRTAGKCGGGAAAAVLRSFPRQPSTPLSGDWNMDEEHRDAVNQPTRARWEAAGRLDGHTLLHRLRAEREIRNSSVAGEDDAPSGDGAGKGAAGQTEATLRRAAESAVADAERLPSDAADNPISERVRDAADRPPLDLRRRQ